MAWVKVDDVLETVKQKLKFEGEIFENICTGERLKDWPFEPISAQAYLGGLGIAEGFRNGADIVIYGRVSDAKSSHWSGVLVHGWTRENLQELANAFVAGYMIECSKYVCGGNFSGFKELAGKNIGYPIAEIGKK